MKIIVLMSTLAVLIVLTGRITIEQNKNLDKLKPDSPLIPKILRLIKGVGVVFYITLFAEIFLIIKYLIK